MDIDHERRMWYNQACGVLMMAQFNRSLHRWKAFGNQRFQATFDVRFIIAETFSNVLQLVSQDQMRSRRPHIICLVRDKGKNGQFDQGTIHWSVVGSTYFWQCFCRNQVLVAASKYSLSTYQRFSCRHHKLIAGAVFCKYIIIMICTTRLLNTPAHTRTGT